MSNKLQLYYIALLPGEELRERVKALKLEMKERFGASHALKSPAHITLQMPFRMQESDEQRIIVSLEECAAESAPFEVDLNGFDCFPPRVLFVRVMNHEPINELHHRLRPFLLIKTGLTDKQVSGRIHPHMTIATRDLTEEAFNRAWLELKVRPFQGHFTADNLTLLKHNGKHWDIYRMFPFGK
ncbi:MAG: 2'-5' RNA ligase family protein [Balneolia bacterium]|nr:2'-5' RNA ligase family protein [Balneolia bacterium]